MFQNVLMTVAVLGICMGWSSVASAEVVIEFVPVGNPGNAGELSGLGAGGYGPDRICGAVDYAYNIGKYEVTAGQYCEFLNAVAATDACGLRLRDVKLAIPRPSLEVPAAVAKGGRPRQVPLRKLPTALACLSAWKAERKAQGAGLTDPLVCAQSRSALGRPLDRRNARARFISACKILGKERQGMLTIHSGRHTCASHLLSAGWPLPAARDMLGHANLSTTSLYAHVVVDDILPPDPFGFAAKSPTLQSYGDGAAIVKKPVPVYTERGLTR